MSVCGGSVAGSDGVGMTSFLQRDQTTAADYEWFTGAAADGDLTTHLYSGDGGGSTRLPSLCPPPQPLASTTTTMRGNDVDVKPLATGPCRLPVLPPTNNLYSSTPAAAAAGDRCACLSDEID
jgi:hypothetical protein